MVSTLGLFLSKNKGIKGIGITYTYRQKKILIVLLLCHLDLFMHVVYINSGKPLNFCKLNNSLNDLDHTYTKIN